MTTANLLIAELAESQAGKAITVNEAFHVLDAIVQCAIIDRDLTAPPGSPVNGNVYIPAATATGAWSGKENQLAQYDVNTWRFHVPEEGWIAYVRDEDVLIAYTGSAWSVLAGGSAAAPFADTTAIVKGSSDATKLARFEVDGLTTGTTRVLTVPDKNFTLAGTDDIATHAAASDPHTGYQKESEKAAASGYASLDGSTLVPAAQLPALVGDSGSGGTKGAAPAPAAGDAAAGKYLKADGTWATVAGASGGTVTSVALSVPAELSVSGSPITTSGTLAVTKANQSANQVFAGPTSGGAAAPAFRALVAADMVYRNLVLEQIVFGFTTDVTTGDGAGYMVVPSPMNGLNLVRVHARVITAGTTGTTDIQIHNVTQAADMLSTKITIDSGETGSDTAATPAVIDTGNDDVATNDLLRIDVDAVSTTKPKGLLVTLEFA